MSDFEQCSSQLQLDLISLLNLISVAKKQIINGGAIRPKGLLFTIYSDMVAGMQCMNLLIVPHSLLMYSTLHRDNICTESG